MIDFIPLDRYHHIVSLILLAMILILSLLLALRPAMVVGDARVKNQVVLALGYAGFFALLLLIGLRPVSYVFGDMSNYYNKFALYAIGLPLSGEDMLFEGMMWGFANVANATLFFFVCALLYLAPLLIASRWVLLQYWPLAFFFIAAQFDFYGYAVNGLRQGIAGSLFLLALTFRGPVAWALVGAAIGFHGAYILPAAAYLLTARFTDPRLFLTGWAAALVVTIFFAGFGEWLAQTGLGGERFDRYREVDEAFLAQLSQVGFRVDFLAYSLLPIAVGFYFTVWKGFGDPFYRRLLNVYLICNAVWLLVIRTPISNRIAYLSWALMGLLIAYPFVRYHAFKGQNVVFALLLAVFYAFTFVSHW